MASFDLSATTGGARKHALTNVLLLLSYSFYLTCISCVQSVYAAVGHLYAGVGRASTQFLFIDFLK